MPHVLALQEEMWISPETEQELLKVNQRIGKKLNGWQQIRWNQLFLPLIAQMERAIVKHRVCICRDLKDDAYLSLARAVDANFLVTGGKDLLSLSMAQLETVGLAHLTIVSPRKFLGCLA
ncbi:MAG: hypothetical protein HYS08_09330 [Chlamydiae bacterium]|nr:hypothetical protein [Chlamydiota bacterium]MBI3265966.1 hypothetical protein [Chlamydiota bacterium]